MHAMSTVTRLMHCSPADVAAVLADGWLYPSWVVGASRMREVSPRWPDPGSTLHHSVGSWPFLLDDTTTALIWDPPRRLRVRARGWPMGEAEVQLDIVPESQGTLVSITERAVAGPGRFVPGPIQDAAIAPRNRETLQRLALLAQRGDR